MEIALIVFLIILNVFWVGVYLKQQRLNRALLHLLHNSSNREYILDHMYFKDVLRLKKDMNRMINADIDTSELEKALKK